MPANIKPEIRFLPDGAITLSNGGHGDAAAMALP